VRLPGHADFKGEGVKDDRNARLVLVVEDNADDERLTVRALKLGQPVRIVVARDGREAIEFLFDGRLLSEMDEHEYPDLILLDLKLPKVNGIEILRRIREVDRTQQIPVVVLTSSDEERDITQCYANGANSYICKPIDFTEFTETVKSVANYWLRTNRLPPAVARNGTTVP
jgi:two-component system, response regulator